MSRKMIKALLVRVNENPKVIEIENSLKHMQNAVGGLVEYVYLSDTASLICNEEGRIRGLPDNRMVGPHLIVGDFLIVGDEGTEEWESLSEADVEKYTKELSLGPKFFESITELTNKSVVDGLNIYFANNYVDPNRLSESYETDMVYAKNVFRDMVNVFIDRSVNPTLEGLRDMDVDMVMVPAVFQSIDTGKVCIGTVTIDLQSSGEHYETQMLTKYGFVNPSRDMDSLDESQKQEIKEFLPYRYFYLPEYSGDIHIDRENIPKEIEDFFIWVEEPEMEQGMKGLDLS